MNKDIQTEKCNAFRKLHQKGQPIVFVNIWDAGSAKKVAEMGAKAIATASWAVADAHGSKDGENLPFDLVEANAKRICEAVDVPVSIDLEAGYGATSDEVAIAASKIIAVGAIGCNIEDTDPKTGKLRSIEEAQSRIKAIRTAAEKADLPFFINARTDVYFQPETMFSRATAIEEVIKRAAAFKQAGANGLFVPRQLDMEILSEIIKEIDLPLNIIMADNLEKIPEYASLGIARISMGPNPYRSALASLAQYKALY